MLLPVPARQYEKEREMGVNEWTMDNAGGSCDQGGGGRTSHTVHADWINCAVGRACSSTGMNLTVVANGKKIIVGLDTLSGA